MKQDETPPINLNNFIVFVLMILQIWYFCNSTLTVQHNGIMDC